MKQNNPFNNVRKMSEIIKLVNSYGYFLDHHKSSSHMIFKHEKTGQIISIKKEKEISSGTRRNIAKLILGSDYYN